MSTFLIVRRLKVISLVGHRYIVPSQDSRPGIANKTRELSRANDGANYAAFKELLCVIKYVLDTKRFGLKLEPTGNANIPSEKVCFSDSDYDGDLVSRRSISGFILYVLGVLVS